MSGYDLILEIERLKEECDKLGFRIGCPSFNRELDSIALFPKDSESLPIYSRNAEVFIGTLKDLRIWLRGLEWARNYDRMTIGQSVDKKRARKEQDIRNKNLVKIITKE